MYNEFDIINNFMVNLYQVDVCSTKELDLTLRYFKIDNANLRTGHRILLVGQTDSTQNDVYIVDSRGYLKLSDEFSNTGKTWRYKAYVKLGDNKGKQFHLKNVGNRFPLTGEKKEFLDGHAYIIKNIFNYDINDETSIIPKLVFTDYEIARLSVNKNYELYSGFNFNSLKSGGYFKIKYHDYEYNVKIDNDTSKFTYTGITSGTTIYNVLNSDHKTETWVLTNSAVTSNIIIGDYVKLTISGDTNLILKTKVIGLSGYNVRMQDYIDQYILNVIYSGSTTYEFTNLMYSNEIDANDRIMESYYAKYFTIEAGSQNTIYPIQYDYNRYFDYDGLSFDINSNQCTISGNITGSVIYNALITNGSGYSTNSDINGDYSLTLPLGTHTLTVSYDHYYDTGITLTLIDEIPLTINFTMTHYTGITIGTITDSWTGATISGVTITATSITLPPRGTISNIDGDYIISNILSGDYTFVFTHPSFITKTTGVTVPDDGTLTLDMVLDYAPVPPTVVTTDITFLDQTGATMGGDVTLSGWTAVTSRGVAYGISINPTGNKTIDGSGTGTYASTITGLTAGTSYYARAYATNDAGTGYGSNSGFTTMADIPIVTTATITLITDTGATSGGVVLNECGSSVTSRGICWKSGGTAPTILDDSTLNGSGLGSFTSVMTGLTSGTTYKVRAYATNGIGTGYGGVEEFVSESLPVVVTSAVTLANVFDTYAYVSGNVTSAGSSPVTDKGICWSLSPNPTLSDDSVSFGPSTGAFTCLIDNLTQSTIYYVRAYAINSLNTVYGNEESLTTIDLPIVTTEAITNLTHTGVTSGGNVTSDGGSNVLARGVCYSTSSNPTLSNNFTVNGTGTGVFVSNVTGLAQGTTYYLRAYATNLAGTTYGGEVSFIPVTTPTVTTAAMSSITSTTAIAGGNVTDNGGAAVTDRGVCYSGITLPTTCSSAGSGTGSFANNITGLSAGNTYYLRAYATNSVGTAYGEYIEFATTLNIGDEFGDGIVFYIDNGHGLIAAKTDAPSNYQWGCKGTSISTSSSLGSGAANTANIVAGCPTIGIAAEYCSGITIGTHDDWYLPSKDEMIIMNTNKSVLNLITTFDTYYWTSTQYDSDYAYIQSFYSGGISNVYNFKDINFKVRPIRSF
jgi:hypothetical protein